MLLVHLSQDRRVRHLLDGHPKLHMQDLEDAILRLVRVCQHLFKSLGRVYEGAGGTTVALNVGKPLRLKYDEEADVLYASIDQPQPAVSVEIEAEVLWRYVPPSHEIVGLTLIYFQEHFPCPPQKNLYEHVTSVVIDLLVKYRVVPEQLLSQA
jgi:hypothetical protein